MNLIKTLYPAAALLAFAQAALAAPKWDFSDYGTQDPAALFQIAWDSDSSAEKLRIRSWLAAQQGSRPEGVFARAWMADHAGDAAAARSLYQECVQKHPAFVPCLANGANVEQNAGAPGPAGDALAALDAAALHIDSQATPLRNAYFYLAGARKDSAAASALLARARSRFPNAWSVDFVEGLAVEGKDPARAATLYKSAIAKGGRTVDAEVFERLIRMETGPLYADGAGRRVDIAMRRSVEYYRQTQNLRNDQLPKFLLDEYARSATDRIQIVKGFEGAGVVPSRELLDQVQSLAATIEPQWTAKLRQQQAQRAQRDPTLNEWLGYMAIAADRNPQEAVRLYRVAIDGAYSDRQRADFASKELAFLHRSGECRLANEEGKALLAAQPALGRSAQFLTNWFEPQLCAGDFAGARQSLDRQVALGTSAGSLVPDEARLQLATAEQAQQAADRGGAFIRNWQAGSGGRLTMQVEFPSGSAQIPASAEPLLRQLAETLRQSQAADYVFEIAGHSDSTGAADQNQKLSQRRAQALVDQLVQRHGISALRLRATGYGPTFPVADNKSEQGRQRNRRVEITPVSSAAAPVIARAGRPSGNPTMSSDGRLLLDSQAVLWDTRQWIALRQLPAFAKAAFSRDGRYVVGLSKPAVKTMDVSFWVYELASSRIVARRLLGARAAVERFAMSPDGKQLATVRDGLLEIMDLPTLERRGVLMLSRQLGSGVVSWVGNDRVAAALRAPDEVLQLVNVASMRAERQFDGVDYVHAIGTSASGRYLVATPNSGDLLVWDTATWQRRQLPRANWGRYSSEYRFHPLREQMIADQWNGDSGQTTVLVDLDTLQVSRPVAEGAEAQAAYTPDGESLYVAGDPVKRLALPSLAPMATGYAELPNFQRWSMYPGQAQVGTSAGRQRLVWDVVEAKPVHRTEAGGAPVLGQPDQRWFTTEGGVLNLVDTRSFDVQRQGSVPAAYRDWSSDLTSDRWVFWRRIRLGGDRAKEGEIAIVDRASGREVARHRITLATEDFIHASGDVPLDSTLGVVVSHDGRYAAASTDWREHWGYGIRRSRIVQVFDLRSGQRVKRLEMSNGVTDLAFRAEQPGVLLVRSESSVNRYKVQDDSFGPSYPAGDKEQILFDDGTRRYLRNGIYVTEVQADGRTRILPASGSTDGMVLPERNLLLLEFGTELRYYDLRTLAHQLSLLAKANGEWIAYTPDGQYSASANGTAGLYWSLGEATLPFAALKEKFERPNVVRERLQSVVEGRTVAVAPIQVVDTAAPRVQPTQSAGPSPARAPADGPAAQLDASFFDPPFKLRVLEAPRSVDGPALALRVGITKTRATELEPAIELNVNGQQIEARGLARLDATPEAGNCMEGTALKVGCESIRTVPLTLEEGRNVVVVNLFFKGGRAQPEVLAIERKKAVATGPLPRLWFFGVGVSQYSDAKYNLNYAHRDAEALAAGFAKQEGKLYAKVNTKLLLNKDADARAIKAEMNRFLRQASSQDLIVIFMAGHGMQDNDQTLYFMTSESNLDEPFTGLGVGELQDFLRRRPMAQKALLLLDICHAGAAAGKVSRRGVPSGDDVINQLANGTGVKVLASSQGREYSLERADFRGGHGAFTAALLEGLEGRAAGGKAGHVTVLDLERFVSQRVPELTKGQQHPTSPDSNNFQDYPIAVQ